jgi:hypothetical protein
MKIEQSRSLFAFWGSIERLPQGFPPIKTARLKGVGSSQSLDDCLAEIGAGDEIGDRRERSRSCLHQRLGGCSV